MSVIVKGMKMPKCCAECEFHLTEDISFEIMHQCEIKTGYIDECDIHGFPYDCPLVEIPKYHGRLIDVDSLDPDTDYDDGDFYAYSIRQIHDAPTIFEAEEAEE